MAKRLPVQILPSECIECGEAFLFHDVYEGHIMHHVEVWRCELLRELEVLAREAGTTVYDITTMRTPRNGPLAPPHDRDLDGSPGKPEWL